LRLSVAAAGLAVVGNILALARADRIYGVYPALINQAVAQDLVSLFVVAPMIGLAAWMALRGSARATMACLAALAFTTYNYVIYTMSVHFGPLFVLWVAVLGLSVYALIGGLLAVAARAPGPRLAGEPRRTTGWFLVAITALFAGLWLSQIVAANAGGTVPASVTDLGVPTNPVHVIDLAIALPATALAGALLLRDRDTGRPLAALLLGFLGLTGLPIMVTPLVAWLRGDAAQWAIIGPIALITLTSAALFWAVTRPVGQT
jgi:hypothetical protein